MTAVTVKTDSGYRTIAQGSKHTWYADEPIEDGGTDTAPPPMEQLLGALGSCMVITVQMYANRKAWPLDSVEVHLEIERYNTADYPAYRGDAKFVSEIREKVLVHGDRLTEQQRERLLEISTKCPVRRILENPTFFVHGAPAISDH